MPEINWEWKCSRGKSGCHIVFQHVWHDGTRTASEYYCYYYYYYYYYCSGRLALSGVLCTHEEFRTNKQTNKLMRSPSAIQRFDPAPGEPRPPRVRPRVCADAAEPRFTFLLLLHLTDTGRHPVCKCLRISSVFPPVGAQGACWEMCAVRPCLIDIGVLCS